MRLLWEGLYGRLVRSITSLRAQQSFDGMKKARNSLNRFGDPAAYLDFVHNPYEALEIKNTIYTDLILEIQEDGDHAALAMDLIWLGLWPGLDAAYRSNLRFFYGHDDELASSMAYCFCKQIQTMDLQKVSRVIGTLVMNTKRDVLRQRKAQADDDKKYSSLNEDQVPSEPIAQDTNLEPEIQEWVEDVVGRDADLVLAVILEGISLKDASRMLGVSYDAGRKRFQRAIKRMRKEI